MQRIEMPLHVTFSYTLRPLFSAVRNHRNAYSIVKCIYHPLLDSPPPTYMGFQGEHVGRNLRSYPLRVLYKVRYTIQNNTKIPVLSNEFNAFSST